MAASGSTSAKSATAPFEGRPWPEIRRALSSARRIHEDETREPVRRAAPVTAIRGPRTARSRSTSSSSSSSSSSFPLRSSSSFVPRVAPRSFPVSTQRIEVWETDDLGRCLVVGGVLRFAERDESAQHEMFAHVPLFAHKDPKDVAIVGSGMGGVVREALKHTIVTRLMVCEPDVRVVDVTKAFFPESMGAAYADSRVDVSHLQPAVFLRAHPNEFHVILAATASASAPATKELSSLFHASLKPGGVLALRGPDSGGIWGSLEDARAALADLQSLFVKADWAVAGVPTAPAGQISSFIAYKGGDATAPDYKSGGDPETDRLRRLLLRVPVRDVERDVRKKLRYYNEESHLAAFVLPKFARDAVVGITGNNPNPYDFIPTSAGASALLWKAAAAGAALLVLGAAGGFFAGRASSK